MRELTYNEKQAIQAIRDKCDWLYNAGMQNNGDYLPKAKNFIEEIIKDLILIPHTISKKKLK